MKEKLLRFMQGRYGTDALSRFLLVLALIFMFLSMFLRTNLFYFLGLIALIYCYFRMFSRNIPKRYAENQLFMQVKNRFTGRFRGFTNELKQRRTHHIYRCPECRQKIRVPKGRGRIAIRCPKCNREFIKKS